VAASKSARARAPPGEAPFSRSTSRKPPRMGNRTHRGAIARLLVDSASTVKASVISQPSVETGPNPHPRRRGPNQAFRPISGEVRTLHYRARILSIGWRIPVQQPAKRAGGWALYRPIRPWPRQCEPCTNGRRIGRPQVQACGWIPPPPARSVQLSPLNCGADAGARRFPAANSLRRADAGKAGRGTTRPAPGDSRRPTASGGPTLARRAAGALVRRPAIPGGQLPRAGRRWQGGPRDHSSGARRFPAANSLRRADAGKAGRGTTRPASGDSRRPTRSGGPTLARRAAGPLVRRPAIPGGQLPRAGRRGQGGPRDHSSGVRRSRRPTASGGPTRARRAAGPLVRRPPGPSALPGPRAGQSGPAGRPTIRPV
jgi:hypothetical protein